MKWPNGMLFVCWVDLEMEEVETLHVSSSFSPHPTNAKFSGKEGYKKHEIIYNKGVVL